MQTLNCNKHKTKVHLYTYVDDAWDMVAKGHIDMITASQQSTCGGFKQIVTKDTSKVTCTMCLRSIKKQEALLDS